MLSKNITDADFDQNLSGTTRGIILFHKKLCPHCLNMQKVIEKFSNNLSEKLEVMLINSEENENSMKAMEVQRVPTLLIIKDGKVCEKKGGLMNPRELKALYLNA